MNRYLWKFFDWLKCEENPDKSWYGLRHGNYFSVGDFRFDVTGLTSERVFTFPDLEPDGACWNRYSK